MATSTVTRNDTDRRYELHVDGELISIADFSERPGAIVVPHVETKRQHRGNDHAATLMAGLVDDLRERGLKIVPLCPYARSYVSTLADADELVAG